MFLNDADKQQKQDELGQRFTFLQELAETEWKTLWRLVGTDESIAPKLLEELCKVLVADGLGKDFTQNIPTNIKEFKRQDWQVIRKIPSLGKKWSELENTSLRNLVRKSARSKWVGFEPKYRVGQLAGFLDESEELILLFRAYGYFKQLGASLTQRTKWLLEEPLTFYDDLEEFFKNACLLVFNRPEGCTFLAFLCFALAFLAFILPFEILSVFSWGCFGSLLLYLLPWRKGCDRNYVFSYLLLLLSGIALFAYQFVVGRRGEALHLYISSGILLLFLIYFFVIIIRKKPGLTMGTCTVTTMVFIAMLFQYAIGFPDVFIVKFGYALFMSSLGIELLYKANVNHEKVDSNAPLYKGGKTPPILAYFLTTITGGQQKKATVWEWPKSMLFIILFVLAILAFSSLFTLDRITCSLLDRNDTSQAQLNILYPLWLSERDQTEIYATLISNQSLTDTLHLEPKASTPIFVNSVKQAECAFLVLGGSLTTTTVVTSNKSILSTTFMKWQLHTLAFIDASKVESWQMRIFSDNYRIVGNDQEECLISIPRLRLPFGLRGVFEQQPFTIVTGIVYGLLQAYLQIWIGYKAFNERQKS